MNKRIALCFYGKAINKGGMKDFVGKPLKLTNTHAIAKEEQKKWKAERRKASILEASQKPRPLGKGRATGPVTPVR